MTSSYEPVRPTREGWKSAEYRSETGARATAAPARPLTFDVGLDRVDVVSCRVARNKDGQDVYLVRCGWRMKAIQSPCFVGDP